MPDRKPKIGIVHLGLGAFFRAHGAVYIADAMKASGGDWGILGVSLQSARVRDALAPQGFGYTAVQQGPDDIMPRRIDVVQNVMVAREDPKAVLNAMADPNVRIVSLTVTEKGYCHNPVTGELDPRNPDIIHDISNQFPRTAPGFITRALQIRREQGLSPFTVLSCDNLPQNGRVLRGVILTLAKMIDPDLADWIHEYGKFPASMVDRIVPATKSDDIKQLASMGITDAAPVMHEPFSQWVIEDDFVDGARPDLAAVNVQMVADVTPFEQMKLRMLNGTHSALAYLGYLAGHETIAETVADPVFAFYVQRLWQQEIIPTLLPPDGTDLTAYAAQLLARYENPYIRHRTWQIAMDGSQKLPQRILGTLADNRDMSRASPGLILAVAGWMRYVSGADENNQPIDVRDPLAEELCARARQGVSALLGLRAVFPENLAAALEPDLIAAHQSLMTRGTRKTIEELL